MATHHVLEVHRAEDIVWRSKLRSKTPSLYVKARLGRDKVKTRVIKENLSPVWNESLMLPIPDASFTDLTVELKHDLRTSWNLCVGHAVVQLDALLEESAKGEAKLELRSPSATSGTSPVTGVVFLHLKAIDGKEAAKTGLESAEGHVERAQLGISVIGAGVSTMVDVQGQLVAQAGLANSVAELLKTMGGFMKFMDELAKIHPYLNAAWQVISSFAKAAQAQVEADQRVVTLVDIMKDTFDFIENTEFAHDKVKRLDSAIVLFFQQCTECCLFIREYTSRVFVRRMINSNDGQKIGEFQARFADLRKAPESGVALQTAFVSARMSETVDMIYLHQQLSPSAMDASNRPQCLPGTRAETLNCIMEWIFSESEQNMLWLHGVAGCGKSTISMTIAEYCFGMSRRGAYLFFVRGKSDPNAVIRTIAHQLASFDHNIARHVKAAVESNSGVAGVALESQFEKLILQPLTAAADAMSGPVAVVLDALDECGAPSDRVKLLKLLKEEFPKLPRAFRFIITSRPEADIAYHLSSPSFVQIIELDYASTGSRGDVSRYIDHEFRDIFERSKVPIPPDWKVAISLLATAADGLFIWASTASKFVSGSDNPNKKLKDLVSYCESRGSADRPGNGFGLGDLYKTVLDHSGIQWGDAYSRERFSKVLGLILLSKVPLSVAAIDDMLGFPSGESSWLIISRLQSVLVYTSADSNAPIRLFHTSFSDYLMAPGREGEQWVVDIPSQRLYLAKRCFDVMVDGLRFNICGIESSFDRNDDVKGLEDRVKKNISPHLEYACRFWAEHLCDVPFSSSGNLPDKLLAIAQHHLLYWFEVLSVTKHYRRVGSRSLYDAAMWTGANRSELSSILWDAYRVASVFATPISESVPHIYLSMLSLAKLESVVAERYSRAHPIVQVHRFGKKPVQPCMKTLQGHTNFVLSVAFSPDGRRIASGSVDETVRVWDAESGAVVAGPFEGHNGYVWSVAFSPDGRRIASGSSDKTVRVWDAESGTVVAGPFEGHNGSVSSVSFSPDGRRIASGSSDKTVRVWDAESGTVVAGPFEGHNGSVSSVSFSPDGRRIASGSRDKTVRVWDAESGAVVAGPFEGHTISVSSVAFSRDGKRIMSCSRGETARVWDVETGQAVSGSFEEHTWCSSSNVSPDGKRHASGAPGASICVSDVNFGKPAIALRPSSDVAEAVAPVTPCSTSKTARQDDDMLAF